ncbi:hypothetical protein TNCV_1327271 [Trichonephila clavipes]|nr:hypothetical protein TNCV_1327271 [Trichonephila clavipes]
MNRHLKRKGIIADHSQRFLYPPVKDIMDYDRHLKRKGKGHCRDKKPTALGIAPNRLLFVAADFGYIIGEIRSKLIESKNIDYIERGKNQITKNISVVSCIKFRERKKNVDPKKKNEDAILRDKAVTMKSPQVRSERKSLIDQDCSKSYIRSSEGGISVHYIKSGSNLKMEWNFKDNKNSLIDTSYLIKRNERKMSSKPFKETKINKNCELLKMERERESILSANNHKINKKLARNC